MERKKLLIADDSEMNRAILANILDQDYEIIEAADGREAIAALQVYHGEISALLLDIIMPEMDGFAVLEEMRTHGWLEEVPVIMISAETGTATIDRAFALGASDYISRPFATRIIRRRIINTILLNAEKHQLMDIVAERFLWEKRNSDILAAILVFGVLIAVHELGHFLAAKACGVRVNEFAIGMGPALFKKTRGDTTYALRLLPIGGFCAMEGEEEDSDDPAALNNQGFWRKLLIFAAGALMNFLTGLVIILVLYAGVKAVNVPVIHGFADGCPLESASGLQVGDRILSIDGERIYTFSDVSLLLGRNKTGDFDLVIRRDGQKLRLENFHMERGEYLDQSGQKFTGFGLYFGAEELTFGGRLRYCWDQAVDFVRLVRLSLQMLITGEAGFSDMSGPVGIVSTITTVGEQSENARAAAANIAYLAALIAVNLAVMNLLPLPALDGGKIFFLVVNALSLRIIRRQIPARFENYVHLAGFVLLMGLMLVITFHDVIKLFQ